MMRLHKTTAIFFLIAAGWALVPAQRADAQTTPQRPRTRTPATSQPTPAQPTTRTPAPTQTAPTPPAPRAPAVPELPTWYLSVGGGTSGPYDMTAMESMVSTKQLTAETFVWKEGMADWAAAGTVPELLPLFTGGRASGGTSSVPAVSAAPEFSTGKRVGMAALNPVLGLGSYIMGDWISGAIVTVLEGAAAGMVFWELSLDKDDDAYLVPGVIAIAAGGTAVVFGIIMPFLYHRTPPKKAAAILDGAGLAVVPTASSHTPDGVAVRLSYRFQL